MQDQLRGCPATRAIANAKALSCAGFRTPEAIYHGKAPGIGSFVFTRKAPGDSFTQWMIQTHRKPEKREERLVLLEDTGIMLGRLHASGFVHRQLSPNNIWAKWQQGRFVLTLTNNEQVIRRHPPSGLMLLKELRSMHFALPAVVGKTDRLRLFNAWRRQMVHLNSTETKIIASAVVGKGCSLTS